METTRHKVGVEAVLAAIRARPTHGLVTALALAALAAGCRDERGTRATTLGATPTANVAVSGRTADSTTPVQQPGAPSAGDWALPGRDWANTRYSPLNQITADNAKNLRVAWTFSTGENHGHEGTPLVVNHTMYVVTPHPNNVFAIDLANPDGPLKWSYKPPTDPAARGEACCDVVNRGAAYADGKLVFNRLDNVTVALDANTGKVLWETKLGDINTGQTMTMAPLIVNGRVFVGNSGGEMGVRGWITALDLGSGKVLWQAYNSGPDKDVLIGPRFKPFYDWLKGTDLGVKSWPPGQWQRGGGGVWGWISYDPELDRIYYGSGNPGVWNPDLRPGDNLWSTATFARDPKTGEALWAYQTTPHDEWDYDAINENIPVDLTINGKPRKALLQFGRTGFVYLYDRETGELLSAPTFQYTNWATGIDMKTGRPIEDPSKKTHQGVNVTNICPASTGAKDQQPAAFSFRTHLFYSPGTNLCMDYKATETGYIAGTPYVGAEVMMYAGPGGNRGEFFAWDPVAGKKVWGIPERFPVWTGALVTGGDVAFYGTMDGWAKAVNARTGQVLWKFKTGSGLIGNFMSYLGPDGKQYVAVYAGVGGWAGAVALGLSPSDPTAALGFVNAMKDLPKYSAPGGMVYVFALP
ncbi:MAG TPA: methanol/ethanol family PQQ-dependent dehydrogenase [Gemmatimonadales bacterium]|nr:methanol/ethanol family PQQ-dependent dehydrogenase [Gemmatimonadales bacterium]